MNKTLQHGLAKLGLELGEEIQEKLLSYLDILTSWNRALSLSAVKGADNMIRVHLLEALQVEVFLEKFAPMNPNPSVWDLGSGMGVPGIVLAICQPNWNFFLVDSSAKKAAFLKQVKLQLKLPNVTVLRERIEELNPPLKADLILARALGSAEQVLNLSLGLVQKNQTAFCLLKAKKAPEEAAQLLKFAEVNNIQIINLTDIFSQNKVRSLLCWRI